jgi:hypothetical protein
MCKRNEEFVDHLLLHCNVASLCGVHSLVDLGCLGLCLEVLSTYLLVRGPLEGWGLLQCRK